MHRSQTLQKFRQPIAASHGLQLADFICAVPVAVGQLHKNATGGVFFVPIGCEELLADLDGVDISGEYRGLNLMVSNICSHLIVLHSTSTTLEELAEEVAHAADSKAASTADADSLVIAFDLTSARTTPVSVHR